jgi:cell division protein FtsX
MAPTLIIGASAALTTPETQIVNAKTRIAAIFVIRFAIRIFFSSNKAQISIGYFI